MQSFGIEAFHQKARGCRGGDMIMNEIKVSKILLIIDHSLEAVRWYGVFL